MVSSTTAYACKVVDPTTGSKCGQYLSTPAKLYRHIKDVHGLVACKNAICGHGFPTEEEMTQHMRATHPQLVCPACDYSTSTKTHIHTHVLNFHWSLCTKEDYAEYWCNACNRPYRLIIEHFAEAHPQVIEAMTPSIRANYLCTVCNKYVTLLDKHIRDMHKEKTSCPVSGCRYSAHTFPGMVKHMTKVHGAPDDEARKAVTIAQHGRPVMPQDKIAGCDALRMVPMLQRGILVPTGQPVVIPAPPPMTAPHAAPTPAAISAPVPKAAPLHFIRPGPVASVVPAQVQVKAGGMEEWMRKLLDAAGDECVVTSVE
ncbi:Zinc finger protein 676 [Carpediemonas membranifera]|uniref:Zinc finger protein 676 n=1 Tax=Carpediemonas membranifera TaxID=201153 RepID=A0A8J6B449_9EUKA|nr:Zinc finger protein 676 [Carpediemonas membranifera]|eukprot:KAG9395313.1 Zinc finger protein 676 [Carpediemonas membranifera]